MNNSQRLAAAMCLTLSVLFLQSCGMTAMMIPVEGPLSKRQPVPILKVRVDGILGNSGNLSFAMPDGDRCQGRWASAAGAGITISSASLLSQYGSVYLSGLSMSTGRGQN